MASDYNAPGYSQNFNAGFYSVRNNTISRLDYFAGLAMQAILSKPNYRAGDELLVAANAMSMAVAMLNELDKHNCNYAFERVSKEKVIIDGKLYRITSDEEAVETIWG